MKAALSLEWLGAEDDKKLSSSFLWGGPPIRKPWLAEIVGKHPSGKLDRVFLPSKQDYTKANGKGSRGIELCFVLETDRLYEVHSYVSWRRSSNYFCAVTDSGDIKTLTDKEVEEWLSAL